MKNNSTSSDLDFRYYMNNYYLLIVWLTLVQIHVELLSHPIFQRLMISVLFLPSFRANGDIVLCSWLLHRNETNRLVSSSAMPIITTVAGNFVAASAYRSAYPPAKRRLRVSSTNLPTTHKTTTIRSIVKCKYWMIGDMLMLPNLEAASSESTVNFKHHSSRPHQFQSELLSVWFKYVLLFSNVTKLFLFCWN